MIFHFWRNGNGNAQGGHPHTFISLGIQKWNEMSHTAAPALHSLFHCHIWVKHNIKRKPQTSTNVVLKSFIVTLFFITQLRAPRFISLVIPFKSVWLWARVCMYSYCVETGLKGSPKPGFTWVFLILCGPCLSSSRWLTTAWPCCEKSNLFYDQHFCPKYSRNIKNYRFKMQFLSSSFILCRHLSFFLQWKRKFSFHGHWDASRGLSSTKATFSHKFRYGVKLSWLRNCITLGLERWTEILLRKKWHCPP